jgi:hypothetical protein
MLLSTCGGNIKITPFQNLILLLPNGEFIMVCMISKTNTIFMIGTLSLACVSFLVLFSSMWINNYYE